MARWTRRRFLGAVGAAAAAGVAGCEAPVPAVEGWPQFRATPDRSGHNPAASGPSDGATVGWSVRTVGPAPSGPVVADGVTYLNVGGAAALGAADGRENWRTPLPFGSGITPLIGEDRLYVAGRFDLYAFDRETGERVWSYGQGRRVANAPGYDGRRVYVGFRGASDPFEATLAALDPATGDEHWRVDVGRRNVLLFAPAIRDGLAVVGKERVFAVDADTGERRWSADYPDLHFGTPAVGADAVYVGATTADRTGAVLALDRADGTERWRVGTGFAARSIAFDGEDVFVASDRVYAIDAAAGRVRWRNGSNRFARASPSVAGDRVYVGGVGGDVVAFDRRDGTERWRLGTAGFLLSAPSIVGSSAYVAGRNGLVYRIDDDGGTGTGTGTGTVEGPGTRERE